MISVYAADTGAIILPVKALPVRIRSVAEVWLVGLGQNRDDFDGSGDVARSESVVPVASRFVDVRRRSDRAVIVFLIQSRRHGFRIIPLAVRRG